jgi:hypothetical protein
VLHLAFLLDLRPPGDAVRAHLSLLAQTNRLLDSAVEALADPNIAYLLLVLGFLGLFLELSSPGTSIPGVLGVICLILAAVGLSQLPFDWRGALLILVAFLLFFADIFVPSLGLLTLSGLALLVAGSYVLFDEAQGVFVNRPLIWADPGAGTGDRHRYGRPQAPRASRHGGRGRGSRCRRDRRLTSGGDSEAVAPARRFLVKSAANR